MEGSEGFQAFFEFRLHVQAAGIQRGEDGGEEGGVFRVVWEPACQRIAASAALSEGFREGVFPDMRNAVTDLSVAFHEAV